MAPGGHPELGPVEEGTQDGLGGLLARAGGRPGGSEKLQRLRVECVPFREQAVIADDIGFDLQHISQVAGGLQGAAVPFVAPAIVPDRALEERIPWRRGFPCVPAGCGDRSAGSE